jgi:hypothetical protein
MSIPSPTASTDAQVNMIVIDCAARTVTFCGAAGQSARARFGERSSGSLDRFRFVCGVAVAQELYGGGGSPTHWAGVDDELLLAIARHAGWVRPVSSLRTYWSDFASSKRITLTRSSESASATNEAKRATRLFGYRNGFYFLGSRSSAPNGTFVYWRVTRCVCEDCKRLRNALQETSMLGDATATQQISDGVLEECPSDRPRPPGPQGFVTLVEHCRRDASAQAQVLRGRRWLGAMGDHDVTPMLTVLARRGPAPPRTTKQDEYVSTGQAFGFEELNSPQYNFVIVGPSGSGKTMLLDKLQQTILADDGWLALHIRAEALGEKSDSDHLTSIIEVAEGTHGSLSYASVDAVYRHAAHRGRLVILIDELEEIAPWSQRRSFLAWLSQSEAPVRFLVAARPEDIEGIRFSAAWRVLRLEPFSEPQARQLLGERFERAVQMTRHDPSLMGVPLNLRVLRDLIDGGATDEVRSQWGVLGAIVRLHLSQRPRSPASADAPELSAAAKLARFAYKAVMRESPCWGRVRYGVWTSLADGRTVDTGAASGLLALEPSARDDRGLDVIFNHLACQEYLVASWMLEERRWARDASAAYWRPDLRGVFRLLASQLGDEFVDAIYPSATTDNALHLRLFTAALLAPHAPPSSVSHRRLARDLRNLLRSSLHRPMAVGGLLALHTHEALGFVIEALKRAIERGREADDSCLPALESELLDPRPLIPWLMKQHEERHSRLAQRALAALRTHLDAARQLSVLRGLCAHAVAKPRVDFIASAETGERIYRPCICFDDLSDAIASLPVAGENEGVEVLQDALGVDNNPLRWILLTALGKLRVRDDAWVVEALLNALRSRYEIEVSATLDALSMRRPQIPSDMADRMCAALLEGKGGFENYNPGLRAGMLQNATVECRKAVVASLGSPDVSRRRRAIQLMGLIGSTVTEAESAALRTCAQDPLVADLAIRVLGRAGVGMSDEFVDRCVGFLHSDSPALQEAALDVTHVIRAQLQDRHVDAILEHLVPLDASDAWNGETYSRSAERNKIGLRALGHVADQLNRKQMSHVLRCLGPLDELEICADELRWIGQKVDKKQHAVLVEELSQSMDPLSLSALIAIVDPSHEDDKVREILVRLSTHARPDVRSCAYVALLAAHERGRYV